MKAFKNNLTNNWEAPHAYKLGIISGDVTLKITVEPDGIFSEIKVLENPGHQSLVQSSIEAIENISGFRPLPKEFPEDNLKITLELHYPPWQKK